MRSLDDVLVGTEPTTETTTAPEAPPVETKTEPTPTGEPEATTTDGRPRDERGRFAPKTEATDAAPPAAKQDEPVFSPATLDERKKRQAAERERDELRRQLEAVRNPPPEPPKRPDLFQDPDGALKSVEETIEQRVQDRILNLSETMIRDAHDDAEPAFEAFFAAAKSNPGLAQQALQSAHPFKVVYQEGKKILAQQEIGDPLTFRERLEKELREKLLAEMQQAQPTAPAPARPVLPTSLADAPSGSVPRGPVFSGPTPLSALGNPALK